MVDSSVWIHFYNKSAHTPELDLILALGTAATTDLIITEVLQGFRLSDKNKYAIALNDLESCIPKPPQDACFRAITALSGQGTLAKECGYLSNKCNAVMEAL